jgi:hypothetical protein
MSKATVVLDADDPGLPEPRERRLGRRAGLVLRETSALLRADVAAVRGR